MHLDLDGDGQGNTVSSQFSCGNPGNNWVLETGDCDDTNILVSSNTIEICDGIKNDCDLPSIPLNEIDNDGDGYVECILWEGSTDLSGGDCNDEKSQVFSGAEEICDSLFNDCDNPLEPLQY